MQQRYETFTLLNAQISRCVRRIKAEEMADLSLKSAHTSCLYYLYRNGSLTLKELCEVCEEDKANVSRSMEYLEENGYLCIENSGKQTYKRHFSLSEKGMAVAEKLGEKIRYVLDTVSEGVSEEERAVMYATLAKISANLQRICDAYDAENKENKE